MIPPILITGCARSGTSLVAGIVELCGSFGGETVSARQANKKGFFENLAIRSGLVKPLLKKIGADPMAQRPLPDIGDMHYLAETMADAWRQQVEDVMTSEGYTGGPWYYKGPKMTPMWPLWEAAFPDAWWVIVRRPDSGIAASCLRTHFMHRYKDAAGWQIWIDAHKERFEEMIAEIRHVREIWPQKIVVGDMSDAQELIRWLGLAWAGEAVSEFVEPALWSADHQEKEVARGAAV